LTIERSYSLDK